jgi:hypothetical protein
MMAVAMICASGVLAFRFWPFFRFSRKLANLQAAVSQHVAHYNFCRVHSTLMAAPGVACGFIDEPWTLDGLLSAIELP